MKNTHMRWLFALIAVLVPALVWADTAAPVMTFTPPNTDVSLALLGKVFGSMPPVLFPSEAGGMIPKMFSIFNMAVLTLGGIVLMYTLIVSTVNTAHEGEVLGKRWSSIWIPLRQVVAFALLVPMQSGYCLMQVFIMWIVLQGIGAADTLWSVALNYLRSGGYIIAAPSTPDNFNKFFQQDKEMMEKVASPMLQSLVCMEGLRVGLTKIEDTAGLVQNAAIAAYNAEIARFEKESGIIASAIDTFTTADPNFWKDSVKLEDFLTGLSVPSGTFPSAQVIPIAKKIYAGGGKGPDPAQTLATLIAAAPFPKPIDPALKAAGLAAQGALPPIPDFISTVTFEGGNNIQVYPQASDPNNVLENVFSGMCGKIGWQDVSASQIMQATHQSAFSGDPFDLANLNSSIPGANAPIGFTQSAGSTLADNATAKAAALSSLMASSRKTALLAMYNQLSLTARGIVGNFASGMDSGQGSALGKWGDAPPMGPTDTGATAPDPKAFRPWITSDVTLSQAPMLAGDELYNAVQVYNSIMQPALIALLNATQDTAWIENSKAKGWISAGSYFFDMAKLNQAQGQVVRDTSTFDVKGPFDINIDQAILWVHSQKFNTDGSTSKINLPSTDPAAPLNFTTMDKSLTGAFKFYDPGPIVNTVVSDPAALSAVNKTKDLLGVTNTGAFIPAYITDYKQYLGQAADYVPPDVLGDALSVTVPFTFKFDTVPFIDEVACWGTFCIGGAIQNVFIKILNIMLIPAINWFYGQIQLLLVPFTAAGTFFINTMILGAIKTGMHPILALAKGGNEFLRDAGLAFIAIATANVFAGLLAGVLIPLMDFLNPFFLMLVGMLLSYGFIFAFYAPLLPFIIFIMAAIGWFVAVIEAIVAAPLVALGLAHPEGDPILGKADPAVCMITNVFLRPTFILLGFIFGFILSYIGILLFNQGFGYIIVGIVGDMAGFGSFFAPFVLAGIYIYVYLDIVSKSFELISKLPDSVLHWIGCSSGGSAGSFSEGAGKGLQAQVQGQGDKAAKMTEEQGAKAMSSAQSAGGKAGGGGGGQNAGTSKATGGQGGGPPAASVSGGAGGSPQKGSSVGKVPIGGGGGGSVSGGGGGTTANNAPPKPTGPAPKPPTGGSGSEPVKPTRPVPKPPTGGGGGT